MITDVVTHPTMAFAAVSSTPGFPVELMWLALLAAALFIAHPYIPAAHRRIVVSVPAGGLVAAALFVLFYLR